MGLTAVRNPQLPRVDVIQITVFLWAGPRDSAMSRHWSKAEITMGLDKSQLRVFTWAVSAESVRW